MRKLYFVIIPLILLLTGCPGMGPNGEWDGTISGEEIYSVDVKQNKELVTITITVDTTEKELLKEAVTARGEEYTEPDELFIWMSPQFGDAYSGDYSGSQNNFWPIARIDFLGDDKTHKVTIDLKKTARDWSRDWLREEHLSIDENWETEDWNDNLHGFFLFASDGYNQNWDSWMETEIDNEYFSFQNSRPAGLGISNLREFPDTGADPPEKWEEFTMLGSGIYAPEEVYGGEVFEITYVAEPGTGPQYVEVRYDYGVVVGTLKLSDAEGLPDELTYTWKVMFGSDSTAPSDKPSDVTYFGNAQSDTWYQLQPQSGWQWDEFRYVGQETLIFKTDFSDNNFFNDAHEPGKVIYGAFGNPDLGYMEKYTEEFDYWDSYGNYQSITPDNARNNWTIAPLTEVDLQYAEYDAAVDKVLGLGSNDGTNHNIEANYDPLRNDIVEFPGIDLQSFVDSNTPARLMIAVHARVELDWDWNDMVRIELRCSDDYGEWWEPLIDLNGPMEQWEREDNNGWQSYHTDFTYVFNNNYIDSNVPQRIRIRFESNDFRQYQGVFIDHLKIYLVE